MRSLISWEHYRELDKTPCPKDHSLLLGHLETLQRQHPVVEGGVVEAALLHGVHGQLVQDEERQVEPAGAVER